MTSAATELSFFIYIYGLKKGSFSSSSSSSSFCLLVVGSIFTLLAN